LLIIPVPGHTKGHTVLLYQNKFLHRRPSSMVRPVQLLAFRNVCWYSWPKQLQSMRQLANYSFEWVLPGMDAVIMQIEKQCATRCSSVLIDVEAAGALDVSLTGLSSLGARPSQPAGPKSILSNSSVRNPSSSAGFSQGRILGISFGYFAAWS